MVWSHATPSEIAVADPLPFGRSNGLHGQIPRQGPEDHFFLLIPILNYLNLRSTPNELGERSGSIVYRSTLSAVVALTTFLREL